jgi:hypothetical protein
MHCSYTGNVPSTVMRLLCSCVLLDRVHAQAATCCCYHRTILNSWGTGRNNDRPRGYTKDGTFRGTWRQMHSCGMVGQHQPLTRISDLPHLTPAATTQQSKMRSCLISGCKSRPAAYTLSSQHGGAARVLTFRLVLAFLGEAA